MREDQNILEQPGGDGGAEIIGDVELRLLKAQVDDMRPAVSAVLSERKSSADTRFCFWGGKGEDGKKQEDALGEKPLPFEGASDNRIRLADEIVREHVMECVGAAQRVSPKVVGLDGTDMRTAGKIGNLLRWLIKTQWKMDYRRECELLAQYVEGDSPGVGLMMVWWHEGTCLERRKLSAAELVQTLAEYAAEDLDEETLSDWMMIASDPKRIVELKELIGSLFPHLNERRLGDIAKALYADGEGYFPMPYSKNPMPKFRALRLYEDVFVPANTTDIQRARCVVLREWFSRAEVLERAAVEGWDFDFVEELLGSDGETGKEGVSGFELDADVFATATLDGTMVDKNGRDGMYEVLTAFNRAVDEDGIPCIHVRKFNYFCETAAKKRDLLDYAHGKYPFVWLSREYLTRRLLESRGTSELVRTEQNSVKLISDSFEDHVQTKTNPPVKVPKGRAKYKLVLAPFGVVEGTGRDDIGYLDGPEYPRAAEAYMKRVESRVDRYFGRDNGEMPESLITLHRQHRIDGFLTALAEVFKQAIQLCQQYMTDEQIGRIVGGKGLTLARSVEEIQGQFDLVVSTDVREWDPDFVMNRAKVMLDFVRPLDSRSVVKWERVVPRIMEMIDPEWADEAMRDADEADQSEADDEQNNFLKILAGIEPKMVEGGINAAVRLQVLTDELRKRAENPGAFAPMSPASEDIAENRVKHLQFLMQQNENAVTGRVGAEPIFGGAQ